MRYFNKKLVVLVFIALILFPFIPKPASAVVTTWETNIQVLGTLSTIAVAAPVTSGATTASKIQQVLEWVAKLATEILKKKLLDMMVDQIITWIQGGGKPKFITNWPAFFRDAVDQAGGEFLASAIGPQICSPFRPLLKAAFIPIPTFTDRTSCTLKAIGANLDAFLKDFKKGNWIAWQEMVLKPQNNVYGAYLITWDEYEIKKAAAAKAAAAEAGAGKGFLSQKRCIEYNEGERGACIENCDKAWGTEKEQDDNRMTCKRNCQKSSCSKYETVTPGVVAADLVSKALGSNIDWLVNAQDLKAYVAAIANAVLNRVFAEGVGLLHSAITPKPESAPSSPYSGVSSAQTQCAKLFDTPAYNDCLASAQSGVDMLEFEKNYLISSINGELNNQNQLSAAKQSTWIVLNQSADILTQLYNCQASTSPALAQQTQITLSQVQNAASTAASQISQIQSDIIALQVKQQEIQAITDPSQFAPFYSQVTNIINQSNTQSLVLAAQQETSQKQQDMNLYQQQLTFCQQSGP